MGLINYLFKNSSFVFLELVIKTCISIFISSYIARVYGVDSFAVFALGLSLLTLGSMFVRFGLDQLVLRDISQGKSNLILNEHFTILCINKIIYITILFFLYLIFNDNPNTLIMIIISFKAIFVMDIFFKSFYYAENEIRKYSLKNIFVSFTYLFFLLLLCLQKPSFYQFIIFYLIDPIIYLLFFYYISPKKYKILKLSFSKKLFKNYLSYSPLFFSSVLTFLYMYQDRWMLSVLSTIKDVAMYSAAFSVNANVFQLVPIILGVISPIIFGRNQNSKFNFKENVNVIGPIFFLLSLISCVLMYLLCPYVIVLIFGPNFSDAGILGQILSLSILLVFWGSFQSIYFIKTGKLKLYLYSNILNFTSNFVLNFFLIPIYESLGAVIATLISGTLGHLFILLFAPQYRKLFFDYLNLKNLKKEILS